MAETVNQGSCLCKGIQYTIRGIPEKVFACYCSDCVKNSGAAYQIVSYFCYESHAVKDYKLSNTLGKCAKFSNTAVEITQGNSLIGTWVCTETSSGYEKHKVFCVRCGCTLWTIPMHHKGEKYIVRSALLDGG